MLLLESELVRVIDGKKVVCVVLMLVLVVCRLCLVFKIFGCCSRIVEESDGGRVMFCRFMVLLVLLFGRC